MKFAKERYNEIVYKIRNNIHPETFAGKVLYLGMGSCYLYRNHSLSVTQTTFIENDENVINKYKHIAEGTKIIHADAYTVEIAEKFDIIVVDIWNYPTDKNNIDTLIDKYKKNLKKNGQILFLESIIKK